VIAAAFAFIASSPATAAEADDWRFAVTPYLWLPNIEGTGNFDTPPSGGGAPEVEIGPVDYLEKLELVLMLAAEAHKGKWSFRGDVVYVDFGDEHSRCAT
jgi:hypothetical protein